MKKYLPSLVRVIIAVMVILFLTLCVFWIPNFVKYANTYVNMHEICLTAAYFDAVLVILAFVLALPFATAIERDCIFSTKVSTRLKVVAALIFTACLILCAGMILLFAFGERLLSPALCLVGLLGMVVCAVLFILSQYVQSAALLKEEVDATL